MITPEQLSSPPDPRFDFESTSFPSHLRNPKELERIRIDFEGNEGRYAVQFTLFWQDKDLEEGTITATANLVDLKGGFPSITLRLQAGAGWMMGENVNQRLVSGSNMDKKLGAILDYSLELLSQDTEPIPPSGWRATEYIKRLERERLATLETQTKPESEPTLESTIETETEGSDLDPTPDQRKDDTTIDSEKTEEALRLELAKTPPVILGGFHQVRHGPSQDDDAYVVHDDRNPMGRIQHARPPSVKLRDTENDIERVLRLTGIDIETFEVSLRRTKP